MSEQLSLKEMRALIDMKNKNPEEYKQFLKDFKGVTKDIFKLAHELAEEMS